MYHLWFLKITYFLITLECLFTVQDLKIEKLKKKKEEI